ncbi:hypothetical protein CYY_003940 [Polysphondylium violaceum]|uniref:sn-1-specific diacylglycerol lipase n=1 Tax=Polysphondylium violaceum TaxID=133409 RepID=A0A8J4PW13_9MYCE|nr:hypothetical protein CYY_003940 [Polysphondylium violaceum]
MTNIKEKDETKSVGEKEECNQKNQQGELYQDTKHDIDFHIEESENEWKLLPKEEFHTLSTNSLVCSSNSSSNNNSSDSDSNNNIVSSNNNNNNNDNEKMTNKITTTTSHFKSGDIESVFVGNIETTSLDYKLMEVDPNQYKLNDKTQDSEKEKIKEGDFKILLDLSTDQHKDIQDSFEIYNTSNNLPIPNISSNTPDYIRDSRKEDSDNTKEKEKSKEEKEKEKEREDKQEKKDFNDMPLKFKGEEANLLFRSHESIDPPPQSPTPFPRKVSGLKKEEDFFLSSSSSSSDSEIADGSLEEQLQKYVVQEADDSLVACSLSEKQIIKKKFLKKKLKKEQFERFYLDDTAQIQPSPELVQQSKSLSELGKKSMTVITDLLDRLFLHKRYSKIDLFMGLALLNSYYKEIIIRNWTCEKDKGFLEEALRYQRFSTAAYGRKLYYGMMNSNIINFFKGLAGTDNTNLKVIIKHTGIKKKDVIVSKWFSSKYSPGHYFAVDHKTKSLVFVIRGTFNHFDIITDLVAKSYIYKDGMAHMGILLCAHMKMREMYPLIMKSLDVYKGYRLVVTGHSLGAGVASLFTILFNEVQPHIPIRCFSFGAPCVLSLELANHLKTKSLISTFCMNDDIIPRLSFNSLFYLREVLDSILSQSSTKIQKIFQIVSANGLNEKMTRRFSKLLKVAPTINLTNVQHSPSGELPMYPPGQLYRIVKLSKGIYVAEKTDMESYSKILVSATMFTDHMPQKYEKGLSSALENFNKPEYTEKRPEDVIEEQFLGMEGQASASSTSNVSVIDLNEVIPETLGASIKS